jgi:hypothetical protein
MHAFVTVDSKTGRHTGKATPEQIAAYLVQPCRHPSFRRPVMVSGVLVDEYTGPGIRHI